MGLDIYLTRFDNFKETQKLEAEYDRRSQQIWDKYQDVPYEKLTEQQKKECNKATVAVAKEMGLSEYGSDESKQEKIELDSKKYPDHYFKIGYFRSSYNEGGINHILRNAIGYDLYEIFDRTRDEEYYFQPDWDQVKHNAAKALGELAVKIKEAGGMYRVSKTRPSMSENPPRSESEALEMYVNEAKEHVKRNSDFEAYGNRNGEFFMKTPLKVVGVIPGFNEGGFMGNGPCVYLIYEDTELEWYMQALEIIMETCEWVMAQEDKEKYYLSWSS